MGEFVVVGFLLGVLLYVMGIYIIGPDEED